MAKIVTIDGAILVFKLKAKTPHGVFTGCAFTRYSWSKDWVVEVDKGEKMPYSLFTYAQSALKLQAEYHQKESHYSQEREKALLALPDPVEVEI